MFHRKTKPDNHASREYPGLYDPLHSSSEANCKEMYSHSVKGKPAKVSAISIIPLIVSSFKAITKMVRHAYKQNQGLDNRWKSMIAKAINQSMTIDILLLISIDWHRPIDDQSIITFKLSQTSLIAIDWY